MTVAHLCGRSMQLALVGAQLGASLGGCWWVTGSFWAGQSDMFGRRTGRWAGAIAGLISDRTRSRKGEKIERIGLEPVSAPWCSVLGGKSDEDASLAVGEKQPEATSEVSAQSSERRMR